MLMQFIKNFSFVSSDELWELVVKPKITSISNVHIFGFSKILKLIWQIVSELWTSKKHVLLEALFSGTVWKISLKGLDRLTSNFQTSFLAFVSCSKSTYTFASKGLKYSCFFFNILIILPSIYSFIHYHQNSRRYYPDPLFTNYHLQRGHYQRAHLR